MAGKVEVLNLVSNPFLTCQSVWSSQSWLIGFICLTFNCLMILNLGRVVLLWIFFLVLLECFMEIEGISYNRTLYIDSEIWLIWFVFHFMFCCMMQTSAYMYFCCNRAVLLCLIIEFNVRLCYSSSNIEKIKLLYYKKESKINRLYSGILYIYVSNIVL